MAMDLATAETVRGDFDDARFTHFDVTSRMFRNEKGFFVTTEGPAGEMDTFRVKYTFGVRPLQQYLVEFDDGRVQCLGVAWDTEKERWFHLYPDERIPHDDWLHWTKAGQNWNYMCAECHSTDVEKNYDLETNAYHTTFSEIDVSCEACHGPGSEHVRWANSKAEGGDDYQDELWNFGLTAKLKGEDSTPQIEMCARCHSRRRIVYPDYHPGDPFLDHYAVSLLNERLYYPDGQILEEVYVYGSFLQSKMYHKGVRCTNCHNPHSGRLVLEGNALCLQCHESAKYNTADHHYHPVESAGASCVECHMPERTYMVVDPRRDHSFQLPRPDLTVELGVPNACNKCHDEETAEWASDAIVEWYGPERPNDPHFAPTFARARRGEPDAEKELIRLVEDPERPAIIRATAVSLLGAYGSPDALAAAQRALKDAAPLVRGTAVRNLEVVPGEQLEAPLTPLLDDPVRFVRTEAARVLSRIANERFADRGRAEAKRFWDVLAEYRRAQDAVSDQPGAHLNLAVLHENLNEPEEAEKSYRTAIGIDPTFVPARLNLATLYARQSRNAEAERLLREAVRLQPDMAEANYSLGLLLAEDPSQLAEAARYLARAAKRAPENARMQYNHGLAMQRLGKPAEAEVALLAAHKVEPRSGDYLNALVVFYSQRQKWKAALPYAQKLARLYPDVPQLRAQLEFIRRNASSTAR